MGGHLTSLWSIPTWFTEHNSKHKQIGRSWNTQFISLKLHQHIQLWLWARSSVHYCQMDRHQHQQFIWWCTSLTHCCYCTLAMAEGLSLKEFFTIFSVPITALHLNLHFTASEQQCSYHTRGIKKKKRDMCLWALRKDFCCGWNQTVLSHFIELSLVNSWMAGSTPKIKAPSQGTLRPCNINGRVVGRLTSLGLLVPACLPILCRLWERARRWGRCLCSPPSNWAGWQGGACAAQRTLYQETASHDVGQLMAPRQNRQQERDRERERETVLEKARKSLSSTVL